MNRLKSLCLTAFVFFGAAGIASAAETAPSADTGDTAWLIVATAFVLFMNIPGLALFYGGLVHKRNVLSVLMHCFVITCVMTIIWLAFGYSLAFNGDGNFIGNFDKAFLKGVTVDSLWGGDGSIPELIGFAFQMTFFIITPALIIGCFVERIKFSALLFFVILWNIGVYIPVCHMVWSSGNMFGITGIIDHAGGIVVHITAGVAALVACIMVGPRSNPMPPHNLPITFMGTAMLWVGWFGFNAGSGLGANGNAAMTLVVTHVSAATGAFTWMLCDWFQTKKPTLLGIATGSIAGLAAITPASGHVGPVGALVIGLCSGALCYFASVIIKNKVGYDDSLDVFGVHGVGGFVGTILVAIFAASTFGGLGGEDHSVGGQLFIQLKASVVAIVYTVIVTFLILKIADMLFGLRVSESDETEGLDSASHGESAYND